MAAVFSLLFLLAIKANAAQARTQSSFVSFTFTSDRCRESYILSDDPHATIPTALQRNTSFTSCAPSLGVTSTPPGGKTTPVDALKSKVAENDLFQSIGADGNGISFEIWLKGAPNDGFNYDSDVLRPILTVGRLLQESSLPRSSEDPSYCGDNQLNFQIAQRGKHLELLYRTSDEVFEACQEYRSTSEMPEDRLTHIVVSLRDTQQLLFINGRLEASLSRPFSNDLSGWQLSTNDDYGLHLLSYPMMQEPTGVWAGTIYRVDLHKAFLSDSDVIALLLNGLPPSSPYALSYTVTINEDAEKVPESHTPDWYLLQSPVHEAQHIELRMGWVDREVRDLQDSLNLTSSVELRSVYTYVTTLPASGCLYEIDGTLIGCGVNSTNHSVLLQISDELQNFVYLPPLNKHSPIDRSGSLGAFSVINYCVSDKVLVSASQCSAHGNVQVVVAPVNDPPVAISPGTFRVKENIDSAGAPKMLLSGTDVDEGDSVQLVQITKSPRRGSLLLSVTSFRPDKLRHDARFADLGNEVASSMWDPVYGMYVWDPSKAKGVVIQGSTASDSFSFRVTDKSGTWSAEQKVNIKIDSAISCRVTDLVTVPEDSREESNLWWFANDTSGYKRDLRFFIEAVPDPKVGVLLYNGSNKGIKSGDLLDYVEVFPYKHGLPLTCHPSPNFCSGLDTDLDISIKFHAVAMETGSDRIISVSDPQVQKLEVVCLRDELQLTAPSGPLSVVAMTLKSAAKSSRLSYDATLQGTSSDSEYALRIPEIMATSYDTANDLVNVTVSTGSGFLTFSQSSWKLADPIHGRSNQRSGSVNFWASPYDLEDVFANLTYRTYTPGEDAIDIYLEYGDCSEFQTEVKPLMWTNSCQLIWHSIPVFVVPDPNTKPSTKLFAGFQWQLLQLFLSMICYPSLFYVVCRLEDTWNVGSSDDEVTVFDTSDPIWVQHACPDTGDFYYENREDGTVTWIAPVGEAYIPWEEEEENDDGDQLSDHELA